MAKALLISDSDLKALSSMSGNVDTDKLKPHVVYAQDAHIQRYLGTDLLEKIQADIIADSLSGNYTTLVQTWVKPALIHWSMVEAIPMLSVNISNGGIFRHEPENGTPLTSDEITRLVNDERDRAVYYSRRLVEYLTANNELFPEYTTNTNEDVNPSTDTNFCSWNL